VSFPDILVAMHFVEMGVAAFRVLRFDWKSECRIEMIVRI
jgi:hypothetical protein